MKRRTIIGLQWVGRELAGALSSLLVALGVTALIIPPPLLQAAPCCAGREEEGEGEAREVSKEDLAKLRAEWERLATAAQLTLDDLDRSRFDLGALQARLGTDPDAIFTWVRGNTRWVPYEGALKGPRGVLLARQGNTLDRALFLGRLLELAGHSVRIANGEASPRRLPDLEKAARASMEAELPEWAEEQEADPKRLAEVAAALGMTVEALRAESDKANQQRGEFTRKLGETTDDHLEAFRELLRGEELPMLPKDKQQPDRVKLSLKQHFWVQLLTGENQWKDYDLFFESGSLPGLVVIRGAAFSPGEIPARLVHKVNLRVVTVATHAGGGQTERVPLEYEVIPSAGGIAEFVLSFLDLGAPTARKLTEQVRNKEGRDAYRKQLKAASEWVPVVSFPNGGEPLVQSGFNVSGDLVPDPLGLGQTVGGSVKAGVSILESLGTTRTPASEGNQLSEVRVEVSSNEPGGEATVEARVIYRRHNDAEYAGPAREAEESLRRALRLSRSSHYVVQTGYVPAELATMVRCERLLSTNLAVRYLLGTASEAPADQLPEAVMSVMEKTDLYSPALYVLASQRSRGGGGEGQFLGSANVLSLVRDLELVGEDLRQREGVDIVTNRVEGLPIGDLAERFWVSLRAGVTDSVLETELHLAGESGISASRRFADRKKEWLLVKSVDDPRLKSWEVTSPTVRDAVLADLAAGWWIVLDPESSGDGETWWRVDPRTGSALGMAASGTSVGGATFKETLIILLRVGMRLLIMGAALTKCFEGYSGDASAGTLLCLTCGIAAALFVFSGIGALTASGWGLAMDTMTAACAVGAVVSS